MRSNASPRMNVVKKEDKESKVRDFIVQNLASRRDAGAHVTTHSIYLLMALSADSPVARAVAALASEIESAGITVQAVFARCGTPVKTDEATGLERVAVLRHAPDQRLLDAHEQLILSDSSVWVGDCMRRDPAKRDAYECYADDSVETAQWAKRAFDQVWTRALPVRAGSAASGLFNPSTIDAATAEALIAMGDTTPVAGATRH